MTRSVFRASVLGLFVILNIATVSVLAEANEKDGIVDVSCEKISLACAKKWADAELDRIEVEITGKTNSVTFSKVLQAAGELLADGTQSLFGLNDEREEDVADSEDAVDEANSELSQARKHKFGKKKKKTLQKLITLAMLFKAKISLILQLISTHFQLKFFVVAIISLLLNAARFWIDLKKGHHPSKVIYYEHAQHQHHYDHEQDDHGGYWKRSADTSPQELAYGAYAEEH